MGFFRSEKMNLYKLSVPKDEAQTVMIDFSQIGQAHFIDLNPEESPYNLPYTSQIKQCEDSERIILYLQNQYKKYGIKINVPQSIDGFIANMNTIGDIKQKSVDLLLDEICNDLKKQFRFVDNQNTQLKEAEAALYNLQDLLEVLQASKNPREVQERIGFLGNHNDIEDGKSEQIEPHLQSLIQQQSNLDKIAGVIDKSELYRLKKIIFRLTKGKSLTVSTDFQNDQSHSKNKKCVYIIIFWEGRHIKERIKKICDSFTGKRFELPKTQAEIIEKIKWVKESINDSKNVVIQTKNTLIEQLISFDRIDVNSDKDISILYIYKMFMAKEKALFQTLNMMKGQNQSLVGYFWAPVDQENTILQKMQCHQSVIINLNKSHRITQPTYIQTNDFTKMFQLVVDTYGVPSYLEANPAVITIVTFPFFFGMMFGDMGHGSIIMIFGLFLVMFNSCLKNGSCKSVLPLRYLLFLMGFMATYCGFIYNEFFAIPVNFFGTCYNKNTQYYCIDPQKVEDSTPQVFTRIDPTCTYPYGMDPIWSLSNNRLTFVNSIKMKMSVIFGVFHMTIGILIKGLNTIYFGQKMKFWTEVFAGLVILLGLFGWMDSLIIAKFFKVPYIDQCDQNTIATGDIMNEKLPSIISIMITTVFGFGIPSEDDKNLYPIALIGNDINQMYQISFGLLLCVLIFVPIMLFTIPCLALKKHEQIPHQSQIEMIPQESNQQANHPRTNVALQDDDESDDYRRYSEDDTDAVIEQRKRQIENLEDFIQKLGKDDHNESFGELFIHQMIETIEFVLGTISNTASYLRLWALSLAHGQLAETFIQLMFASVLKADSQFYTVLLGIILWPLFMSVTFAVLLCMDSLECFLHTLRLHWVEFQNKFFKGDGYMFKPYSLQKILTNVIEE